MLSVAFFLLFRWLSFCVCLIIHPKTFFISCVHVRIFVQFNLNNETLMSLRNVIDTTWKRRLWRREAIGNIKPHRMNFYFSLPCLPSSEWWTGEDTLYEINFLRLSISRRGMHTMETMQRTFMFFSCIVKIVFFIRRDFSASFCYCLEMFEWKYWKERAKDCSFW